MHRKSNHYDEGIRLIIKKLKFDVRTWWYAYFYKKKKLWPIMTILNSKLLTRDSYRRNCYAAL